MKTSILKLAANAAVVAALAIVGKNCIHPATVQEDNLFTHEEIIEKIMDARAMCEQELSSLERSEQSLRNLQSIYPYVRMGDGTHIAQMMQNVIGCIAHNAHDQRLGKNGISIWATTIQDPNNATIKSHTIDEIAVGRPLNDLGIMATRQECDLGCGGWGAGGQGDRLSHGGILRTTTLENGDIKTKSGFLTNGVNGYGFGHSDFIFDPNPRDMNF